MYKSSVLDLLASLPEDQFLEQVSHGVALIGQSLESLERAGEELHKLGYVQGSEVLRRLAEEEAAKALILFDAVRCPRREESRRQITLARFRDHLAKGIYAKASSWRYFKFQEFRDYVQACRNSLHLDGPNDVDWIFRNEITASRENAMYVDYVRDITEPSGDQFWSAPPQDVANASSYASSDAARLVRAITNVGASTPFGLAVLGDVWQGFDLTEATIWPEIRDQNMTALRRLTGAESSASPVHDDVRCFVNDWIPPLWSVEMSLEPVKIEELRRQRDEVLAWRREQASKRDPAPIVPKERVVSLSELYGVWEEDVESADKSRWESRSGSLVVLNGSFFDEYAFQLESYGRLISEFERLTREERVDLAALAWFARRNGESWTSLHEHAARMINDDFHYEIGLGKDWLEGFQRWEEPPPES